jgi:hypothetical protein
MMAVLILLSSVTGTPAAAQTRTLVDSARAIQLEYPAGWSCEEVSDGKVRLLMSPVSEADWQTNVYLELRTVPDVRWSSERRLSSYVEQLELHRKNFVLRSSRVLTHSSGLAGGELIFSDNMDGVPLTQRELLLWYPDGRELFVAAAVVTSLWSKYEDQVDLIFDSLRPIGPGIGEVP